MAGKLPQIIGNAAVIDEKPPIDFTTIEGERPLVDKRTLKICSSSETVLRSLKPDGRPERKFWDTEKKLTSVLKQVGHTSFKLRTASLPQLEALKKGKKVDETPVDGSPAAGGGAAASKPALDSYGLLSSAALKAGIGADGKPLKRSERYYQLLMKAHNKREEEDWKVAYEEEWQRCEGAARIAYEKVLFVENPPPEKAPEVSSDASEGEEDDEEEEEEEQGDYGDLTAYDGQMKIEIDFVVVRPPGEEDLESIHESDRESSITPEPSSSGSTTPPIDFSEELEALKAELKTVDDKKDQDDGDDGIPEGLRGLKKMPNMWDNPFPEWTLDMGGSVFFIPDAERYAFAPSLPPPPPPGLQGRRRIRLKPRLPLDISNHRYRDEHPNIWAPAAFSPELEHYQSFEQKMMTFDLYKACLEGLSRIPQQTRAKQERKHKHEFSLKVDDVLGRSVAWRNWRNRERARQAREEAEQQAALAEAMAKKLEKEAKLKALEEAAEGEEQAAAEG
eukprot:TRINITY_DN2663_c1_g1_i1.p1 TRINITY_DN2663_c1_g1~~TRINITY_DN2663_c1_g1_i1.p1  ORF type:complete len:505 (+),score=129.01 TRINITY_DN2663_c1_g1_i1:124-1638(+)